MRSCCRSKPQDNSSQLIAWNEIDRTTSSGMYSMRPVIRKLLLLDQYAQAPYN